MQFARDMGKSGGAAGLAFLYEEIVSDNVVNATGRDGKISPFDLVLQVLVGWGPIVLAAHQSAKGSHFWTSFGGAVMFNRIDNIAIALGQPALTRMGAVLPGETIAQAQSRIAGGG